MQILEPTKQIKARPGIGRVLLQTHVLFLSFPTGDLLGTMAKKFFMVIHLTFINYLSSQGPLPLSQARQDCVDNGDSLDFN